MPIKRDTIHSLLEEARRLGKFKTRKAALRTALNEYITRRKQLELVSLFGTIDYDTNYDYKRERYRKPIAGLK